MGRVACFSEIGWRLSGSERAGRGKDEGKVGRCCGRRGSGGGVLRAIGLLLHLLRWQRWNGEVRARCMTNEGPVEAGLLQGFASTTGSSSLLLVCAPLE